MSSRSIARWSRKDWPITFFLKTPLWRNTPSARTFIEPQIVRICTTKITEEDIEGLEENVAEMEKEPDGEIFNSDLDIAFHKKLVDIAGNSILSVVVESIQTALIRLKRVIQTDQAFLDMVCRGHREIIDAFKERDGEKASQCMLQHINDVEKGMRACKIKKMAPNT